MKQLKKYSSKVKKYFNNTCIAAFCSLGFIGEAIAAGDADDVFEDLNEKTGALDNSVRVWGWSIAGLAFVIGAIAAMAGKMPKEMMKNVLIGCCMIIASTEFISFMRG